MVVLSSFAYKICEKIFLAQTARDLTYKHFNFYSMYEAIWTYCPFGYFCQKQINHLDNFLNIGNYEQTVYMYQL